MIYTGLRPCLQNYRRHAAFYAAVGRFRRVNSIILRLYFVVRAFEGRRVEKRPCFRALSYWYIVQEGVQKKPDDREIVRRRGGGYLLFHFRSIIGVARFNFSVRNGKRWSPCAMATLVSFCTAVSSIRLFGAVRHDCRRGGWEKSAGSCTGFSNLDF